MKLRAALWSALFVVSCSSVAGAGPIADAAQRAEALQAGGKTVEALQALDEAVSAIWDAAPLAFRKVVLVDFFSSMGVYSERADRTFRPDDKLKVYVEPVAFGYGGSGKQATIGFKADLAIENTTGQVLTEVKDLFSVSAESARDRREFGMMLSFAVPYLRPGDYLARFTVHDQNSDKSGKFDVPFTVAAPAAASASPEASKDASAAGQAAGQSGAQTTTP